MTPTVFSPTSRRHRGASWLLVGALALLATGLLSAQTAPFRASVDVVSLTVTVTDTAQRLVSDLTRDEFEVFEDGVKQEVTFFTATRVPIALSILLDTSASMEGRLPTAQDAAIGFAKRMGPQDIAQVIDFDSRATIVQTFTQDQAALERAIRSTAPGGSTSLYNAVYIALQELKKTRSTSPDDIRRQAIVLLSDGEDTSSLVGFDEVLNLAKRSDTAIYTIGIRANDLLQPRSFREAEYVLRQLASETGGRAFFPTAATALPEIYSTISTELSSQYSLGYSSKNRKRDGAWRRVVVRLTRPSTIARTKQGYFAPTS